VAVGNRRLVPMPPGKTRRPAKAPKAKPVATIAPSGLKTWQTFAFLVVIVVLWHYLRGLLIIVGMAAGLFWCLNWLCHRFPRTGYFVLVVVKELLRGGRRRR
jgi:hypothetical protein